MSDETITADRPERGVWDVAVVGAGPAGCACAIVCAHAGARTLLIDRSVFPREKVCGHCLSARGLAAAEGLIGADAVAQLRGAPMRRASIWSGGREAQARLAGGVVIERASLDAALARGAMRAGAAGLFGRSATLATDDGAEARTLTLRGGGPMRARVVVAADGVQGRLLADEPGMAQRVPTSSRMGAACTIDAGADGPAEGEVRMCVGREGYVGMARLRDGRTHVAAALRPASARRAGGPGALAERILRCAGAPRPRGLEEASWRGAGLLTRRRRPAGRRVLAVGDAACFVEPFTGEGMTWAMESGALAARFALRGAEGWSSSIERALMREHARRIGRSQLACRVIAAALRRPALTGALLRVGAWAPGLGDAVAASLHARGARA